MGQEAGHFRKGKKEKETIGFSLFLTSLLNPVCSIKNIKYSDNVWNSKPNRPIISSCQIEEIL